MRLFRIDGIGGKRGLDQLTTLQLRGGAALDAVLPAVRKIVRDVREKGDASLLHYASKFGELMPGSPASPAAIFVYPEETERAWESLDSSLKRALEIAAANIRDFAESQMPQSWQFPPAFPAGGGLTTGQLVRPLRSVGCYVPGGRHPLPSTMLMTVIPAQVAGVQRIVVTSPRPAPETLAAAHLLGVKDFYRVGGAHAVAALAYGTESFTRVDKIVGPGNLYVTAAKRLVAFDCAIDMLAGPTEIVVTSEQGSPQGIAADLVAQAEHDTETLAILITTNETLAKAVMAETKQRSRHNPVAREALRRNGYVFLMPSKEAAQRHTNALAPEHLTVDFEADLKWVQNAGSVFVGKYSPQPMGDYISGPNHTLPTGGQAAVRGGLSVMDFVKLITVQEYTAAGLDSLGAHAIRIAEAEGLTAHAEAIRGRRQAARRAKQNIKTPEIKPRARVAQMPEYHPPLGNRNKLRLDFNENTIACSPAVKAALENISAEVLTRYPEREPVEALAAAHLGLHPEQVMLTNGVDEAIHVLSQAYLDSGDEMLLPVPTYSMYEIYGSSTDAAIRKVQAEAGFKFPFEKLLTAINWKTRLIAIANPNSPTGSVATREQIVAIAEAAPGAVVLVDEAYYHFYGQTVIDLVGKLPNLIVARTFSKAYGLASLRLGLLAGPEYLLRWTRRVLSPYSVNHVALTALTAALNDRSYLDWYVSQVKRARTEFLAGLAELGLPHWPTEANFVLVDFGAAHEGFVETLRDNGILVRDRSTDPGCWGCVRITIGTPVQMRGTLAHIRDLHTKIERFASAIRES